MRLGRAPIVEMIRAAVEHVRTVHHGYTPEIEILDENTASGMCLARIDILSKITDSPVRRISHM